MENNYFDGHYFKHQKGGQTLCLIAGISQSSEFIQVITNKASYNVPYIGENLFTGRGIKLNIKTDQLELVGKIAYKQLTPIKYDIMGPFKYVPMECRHGIVSMRHDLKGYVMLNGEKMDFTGGVGYIENDSGKSFPKSYAWFQCNDFHNSPSCSVMVSVADIPFCGTRFKGCICVIHYNGKEYRLATYLGVRVLQCDENRIILKQGKYVVVFNINPGEGHLLAAPKNGEMTRVIIENPSCVGRVRFYINNSKVFDLSSEHCSFEYED